MPETRYVLNELLTYASFYIGQFPPDKIQSAILRHFVPAEIDKAKDVLWMVLGETVVGKKTTRNNSVSRSAVEANVRDIISALKSHTSDDITYVANNLDRMPRWAPEELSLLALASRVSAIENELITVKTTLASNQCKPVECPQPMECLESSEGAISLPVPTCSEPTAERNQSNTVSYSAKIKSRVTPASIQAAPKAQTVPRQRQPVGPPARSSKTRPKPVVGKKKIDTVKGECRKADLFLYRVCHETDDNSIRHLFTDANIPLYDFNRVSHPDARMKSYRVTVAANDIVKVCNDEFLPEDIMCRRFYRPKPKDEGVPSEPPSSMRDERSSVAEAMATAAHSRSIVQQADVFETNSDDDDE